ncbi:IS3 family transposase [Ligilactobacillus saerimneri]|uniref:IS3 family transposase n=1 Tax=Ligilactobacillus saerimneri TaxID=228229 RepID=A0A7H9EM46_9LACO|nr:IS3 family transposase [Ligilactobacillus saerimneri]QLL78766.1 IS3 family transposase [Ligilactobacillus saerimneri]QLL78852.1 IS3 family transposase [Ligilactobacillus saerimneri]QLL78858.1 IS3 family transposase [Ligilactobacillus saerimneri]
MAGPVRTLKAKQKTQIVDQIRAEQTSLPKEEQYSVGEIIHAMCLKKATYYDERKRITNEHDKYVKAKQAILRIAKQGRVRGRWTYGYRRVNHQLRMMGIHLADMTVNRLMAELNVQATLYNRHRNGKYSSYKGRMGKVADNLLNQTFDQTQPYQVLHTDVTQVRLANHKWAYISSVTDEASKEVLAFQISSHPDRQLIIATLKELSTNLPDGVQPIIHSDQGWHYQSSYYTQRLADHNFIQSMSRKGNCLDNAPIESFFHLFKTELLDGFPPCKDIEELKLISRQYIHYFNYKRISLKTKGMTPVEYRNHTLVA